MASNIGSDWVSFRKPSISGRAANVAFKTIAVRFVVILSLQGLNIIDSQTTGPSLHRRPAPTTMAVVIILAM